VCEEGGRGGVAEGARPRHELERQGNAGQRACAGEREGGEVQVPATKPTKDDERIAREKACEDFE
jgi:hypothetical protein